MAALPVEIYRKCTKVDFQEVGTGVPTNAKEAKGAAVQPVEEVASTIILPVTDAAFASHEKKAYLAGGYSHGDSLNQVLEYDFTARQWTNLPNASLPFKRSEGQMVCVENTLYFFGGYNDKQQVCGDMWKLEVPSAQDGGVKAGNGKWEEIKAPPTATVQHEEGNTPSSQIEWPCARRSHSMITFTPETVEGQAPPSETLIYLFGGFNGEKRLNDLWCFQPSKLSWQCLRFAGLSPEPRDSCTFLADPQNKRLILFGGFTSYRTNDLYFCDLTEQQWVRVVVEGGPSPRMGCFGCVNGPYAVFGLGQESRGPTNLICQLNLVEMKWTVAVFEGDEISGRVSASYAIVDGGKKVLVFGGTNDKKYSNSLLELELERGETAAPTKGGKK